MTYACVCVYIYTYIYIHTHTYIQVCGKDGPDVFIGYALDKPTRTKIHQCVARNMPFVQSTSVTERDEKDPAKGVRICVHVTYVRVLFVCAKCGLRVYSLCA